MKEEANHTPDTTLSAGFRRELDSALALLPDRYRQPLVLFHLEGAPLHEVAQRLELQPSTLRTRLSRARDMLRQLLSRRGVEVSSVGVLGLLFAAEAKAAALPAALLSTVLDTAAGGGGTIAPHILKLADKAAAVHATYHSLSITTLILLMKTKATLIAAAVIALAAIGTTAYVIQQRNDGTGKEAQNAGRPDAVSQDNPSGDPRGKARTRAPQFQSIEEAEQALLDFDLKPLSGPSNKESEQCLYRYQSLTARIPKSYYSELARRLGGLPEKGIEAEGVGQTIQQFIRQMALYQEWGRVDFDAALADLSNIGDKKAHSKALHNVFVGAMGADPLATMKKAETLEIKTPGQFGDFERIDLMDTIFDHWIQSDAFSALEWARQAVVPAKRRDQWIADGLRAWNEKDPAAAAKWSSQ